MAGDGAPAWSSPLPEPLEVGQRERDTGKILVADVALGDARRARNWNAFNQVLRDRRSDLYDEMLGSSIKRGWY